MERQIEEATFVLIVCTAGYLESLKNNGERTRGRGVTFEIAIIYNCLYDAKLNNERFIPILFEGSSPDDIPILLKGYERYEVSSYEGYKSLYNSALAAKPWPPVIRSFLLMKLAGLSRRCRTDGCLKCVLSRGPSRISLEDSRRDQVSGPAEDASEVIATLRRDCRTQRQFRKSGDCPGTSRDFRNFCGERHADRHGRGRGDRTAFWRMAVRKGRGGRFGRESEWRAKPRRVSAQQAEACATETNRLLWVWGQARCVHAAIGFSYEMEISVRLGTQAPVPVRPAC